jgi:GH15 family glucan-1,4-alpha-glucosidase
MTAGNGGNAGNRAGIGGKAGGRAAGGGAGRGGGATRGNGAGVAGGDVLTPRVLREYALVADGERGALIAPDGSVAWLCVPRWDSPAAFSGLLGAPGRYTVTPADPWHVWGGYYETGSLIWRSRWVGDGRIECREALAMPGDPQRAVLLRRIEALDGAARASVLLDLRAGYGRGRMTDLKRHGDVWTGRSGPAWFRLSGAGRARRADRGLAMTVRLAEGAAHDLVLEISDSDFTDQPPDPGKLWAATEEAWSQVAPGCDDLIAVSDARHAYAVLRGLTSASGAMVAAATTSLPERLEAGRNYDYRYAWIRDQCYAGLALAAHGPHPMLAGAVRFITERLLADGPGLMPGYTVAGEPIVGERRLRLRGFPGGGAKTGNWVRQQFQLDAFGETLSLLAAAAGHDMLGAEEWRAAEVAAAAIEQRWPEPDAGIWELDNRRWAHSRLACVSGLRAIAGAASSGAADIVAAGAGSGHRAAARWSSLADAIAASLRDCVHPAGRWQRAPDDERLDAALLQPVIRGGFAPGDPRNFATIEAVRSELAADGFVYRFRHDARPLHKAEGAFLLCGFWMAQVEHALGNPVAAAHWFERNRSATGPAALYTEEYDVHQRQLRGNVPQAFVHAAMLECAVTLSRDVRLGGRAEASL